MKHKNNLFRPLMNYKRIKKQYKQNDVFLMR